MKEAGLVVVVSGPSGVGKGAVVSRLLEQVPNARLSVSVTTRKPRPGEQDGVDYRFVSGEDFNSLVADDALLEHARYAGSWYGTPHRAVADAVAEGAVILLEIEVQGALQVKHRVSRPLLVFLEAPSMDELERRLRERGTEDESAISTRLARAHAELQARDAFDICVVNDDLDRCVAQVALAIAAARAAA